jgi:uncharacterized protein (DUF362 family)
MDEGQRGSRESVTVEMTRRQFVAATAGGVAALALPRAARASAGANPMAALTHAPGEATPVALAGVKRGAAAADVAAAVRRAALAATDFSWLSHGDSVLIKPVCNSGNVYPATTDPVALHAMVHLLFARGAGRVVVADMSGVQFVRFYPDATSGSTRALMTGNGLAKAAEEAGAVVHAFEEAGWDGFFAERLDAAAHWDEPLFLPNILRQVDHVVLMPRCSRHIMAGSTLGLKAAVGWWRHDARLTYHRGAGSLAEKTAEANLTPTIRAKQRLVLTSATKVLATFGPDEGHVVEPETGLIIASPSVVAHDTVSLCWLLENRRTLTAAQRGGPIDDPFDSGPIPELGNRIVVNWLGGGLGGALGAERLRRHSFESLWQDRVLRRAYELAGGVPRLEIRDDERSVPVALRQRLEAQWTVA